jgi:acetyl esterase/lipase
VVSLKFAVAALFFTTVGLVCAQTNQAHIVVTDIPYCTAAGQPLLMDILVPETPVRTPTPVVLWLDSHGKEKSDKESSNAVLFTDNGFVTAIIGYRSTDLAPFPAAIEDCKCAVRFLRANAAQYGIDPDRIGVAGSSAGGHLALLLATANEDAGLEGSGGWSGISSQVAAASAWYAPTDFTVGEKGFQRKGDGKFLGVNVNQKSDIFRKASPITYVSADSPPILLIHGDHDKVVPFSQSIRMMEAYKRVGATAELVKVVGVGHKFKSATAGQASVDQKEIQARTVGFFKTYLAEK